MFALAYVKLTGALNAPPAVPVKNVSLVGYISPLRRVTSPVTVNWFVLL